MKKKLLVSVIASGMVLTGILTGCGSNSPSESNNGKENSLESEEIKETDETVVEEEETTAAEEYEIGPDTYVSSYKYMITLPTINAGTRCAEVCGGTEDFYSVVAVQGIGEDDAKLYDIDLTKDFSDEEILEAVQPSVYMMLGNLHDTKDDYPSIRLHQDAAEFKYDDITSVEIGDYEFTKATGQIVVSPAEYAKEGAKPYYMNTVLYARKLTSGNLFYYFEYNDCNITISGVDGPIELSIEELADNAEKNLKTFREYEGDSYDLYQ